MNVSEDLRSIAGAEITAVTLDYRVSLQLEDPQRLDASLVLGVPFRYGREPNVIVIDAEDAPTLEPAWRLLRRRILSASADDDLNLTIVLDDGSQLTVSRSDQWDAWELHAKGVSGVLAGPR